MSKNQKTKIIFLAGSSYSGSTILGIILGADKKVINCGEIDKYKEIKLGKKSSGHLLHKEDGTRCAHSIAAFERRDIIFSPCLW